MLSFAELNVVELSVVFYVYSKFFELDVSCFMSILSFFELDVSCFIVMLSFIGLNAATLSVMAPLCSPPPAPLSVNVGIRLSPCHVTKYKLID